jgi:hypothetical protein
LAEAEFLPFSYSVWLVPGSGVSPWYWRDCGLISEKHSDAVQTTRSKLDPFVPKAGVCRIHASFELSINEYETNTGVFAGQGETDNRNTRDLLIVYCAKTAIPLVIEFLTIVSQNACS